MLVVLVLLSGASSVLGCCGGPVGILVTKGGIFGGVWPTLPRPPL